MDKTVPYEEITDVLEFMKDYKSKIKWRKNFCFRGTISVKINLIPQGFILSGGRDET